MNESITLEFRKDGVKVPVNSFNLEDGIVLGNETSAWPITMAIGIVPASPITAFAMDGVRQRMDWRKPRYLFNVALVNGALRVTGVKDFGLPAGRYKVSIDLKGVRLHQNQAELDVPKGGSGVMAISLARDKQRFEFFPDMIPETDVSARVLDAPESVLDGQPVLQWLKGAGPRIERKACLLNILAALRCTPAVSDSLCAGVRSVFFADVDRICAALSGDFPQRLRKTPGLHSEGAPTAGIHARMLTCIPGRRPEEFRLESFRIGEFNSLQFCLAVPRLASDDPTVYADIDIDLGNPLASLGGLIVHLGELIDPGQTNHLNLFSKLRQRSGIGDFLYYGLADAANVS